MKNFELINLLNFGNVLVQPYENSNLKLKNIIEKTESKIRNKFQDSEIGNKFIKQYGEWVGRVNFIVKDLLDFSSLGFSSSAEQIYLYLLSSGY